MEEVYKIQAAFVKNEASTALESREGYHVWRLIKEMPQSPPTVLEVFEPRLAVQTVPGIAIADWHVKAELENFTPTHNQCMVYGETGSATDVQARWNRAKEYLSSELNSFHFNHRGPLDRITQYEMKNVIYDILAKKMGIQTYSFIENSLFKQQIASQSLLVSYKTRSLTPSNFFTPSVAKYKIVSAINYDVLKSITAVDITQLNSKKAIHHPCKVNHFWMLTVNYGGPDKVIEVVQGLPAQKTKAGSYEIIKDFSFKTRNAVLSIHIFSPEHNYENAIAVHDTKLAYEGKGAVENWQRMKTIIPLLNNEQVPYSFLSLGMSMFGGKATNGNSAYASIGFIFERLINSPHNSAAFKIPLAERSSMPGLIPLLESGSIPGFNNPVLSRTEIWEHFDRLSASSIRSLNKF